VDHAGDHRAHSASTDVGLLALTVIWGVNFTVIKAALETLEPMAFNALRFPIASAVLLLALRLRGGIPWPERRDLVPVLALGLLGNVAYQLLFIIGIDLTFAGNASLMLATTPVWTLMLSKAIGAEHHGPVVWVGVIGTLLGATMVVVGGGSHVGLSRPLPAGDLLTLLAAITWAGYTVGGRNLTRHYGALAVTSWTLWIGTFGLVILGIPSLTRTNLSQISPATWVAVGYAGVFAIAIAYLLWYHGVKVLGPSRTAVYSNLIPVVALVTAAVWLRERPGPFQTAGAIVILLGVWLVRSDRTRGDQTSAEPD
jgi:drug/metabolite transporter (DMT)-like permease